MEYLRERDSGRRPELVQGQVIGVDTIYVDATVVLENLRPLDGFAVTNSRTISHAEWEERNALNFYLQGFTPEELERKQRHAAETAQWGDWARDPVKKQAFLEGRLDAFRRVSADPRAYLDKFRVRYAAVRRERRAPAFVEEKWKK